MNTATYRSYLITGIAFACSVAIAGETQQPGDWKQGWDRQVIESYSQGCTDSFVDETNRARVSNRMNTLTATELRPFRNAVQSMCSCITERLATTGSYAEVKANQAQRMGELLREANAGGQCNRPVSDAFTLVRTLVKR
jgi:hypothetical protein